MKQARHSHGELLSPEKGYYSPNDLSVHREPPNQHDIRNPGAQYPTENNTKVRGCVCRPYGKEPPRRVVGRGGTVKLMDRQQTLDEKAKGAMMLS